MARTRIPLARGRAVTRAFTGSKPASPLEGDLFISDMPVLGGGVVGGPGPTGRYAPRNCPAWNAGEPDGPPATKYEADTIGEIQTLLADAGVLAAAAAGDVVIELTSGTFSGSTEVVAGGSKTIPRKILVRPPVGERVIWDDFTNGEANKVCWAGLDCTRGFELANDHQGGTQNKAYESALWRIVGIGARPGSRRTKFVMDGSSGQEFVEVVTAIRGFNAVDDRVLVRPVESTPIIRPRIVGSYLGAIIKGTDERLDAINGTALGNIINNSGPFTVGQTLGSYTVLGTEEAFWNREDGPGSAQGGGTAPALHQITSVLTACRGIQPGQSITISWQHNASGSFVEFATTTIDASLLRDGWPVDWKLNRLLTQSVSAGNVVRAVVSAVTGSVMRFEGYFGRESFEHSDTIQSYSAGNGIGRMIDPRFIGTVIEGSNMGAAGVLMQHGSGDVVFYNDWLGVEQSNALASYMYNTHYDEAWRHHWIDCKFGAGTLRLAKLQVESVMGCEMEQYDWINSLSQGGQAANFDVEAPHRQNIVGSPVDKPPVPDLAAIWADFCPFTGDPLTPVGPQ